LSKALFVLPHWQQPAQGGKMQDCDLELFRIEKLTEAIEKFYGNRDIDDVEAEAEKTHEEVFTELFEVSAIVGRYIELHQPYDETIFYPVIFPPDVFALVECGDKFLVTIARRKRFWKACFVSSPRKTHELLPETPDKNSYESTQLSLPISARKSRMRKFKIVGRTYIN
jgi:hypothetical protein